ncbi:MAG: hypothetical protein IT372_32695 [Polyangiaceae bacterium]|nr:hypothetical protein [Polyangiaceae bacterium]
MTSATAPPARPLLERLGVLYFRRLSASMPRVRADDAVSVLNPEERRQLRRIGRGAVIRACVAGVLSAAAAATAEVLAEPLLGPTPGSASLAQTARYWGVVLGVTGVAAVLELLFLYWDSLRSVHALARAAGLDLFPAEPGSNDEREAVAAALARAALELPNPTDRAFGVDPRREASRLRLVVASLLYKLKVSVTSFALKVLVRRLLGRALVRAWLPFVAVPVTAAWNGAVAWIVLREARVRAMGPSAAAELVDAVLEDGLPASREGRVALARAVASAIVRTEDLHPNLFVLLREVVRRVGEADGEAIDDPQAFIQALPRLDPREQRAALQILTVAAIIDGRLTAAERSLLAEAQAACGRAPDHRPAERLRRAFVAGRASLEALVRRL